MKLSVGVAFRTVAFVGVVALAACSSGTHGAAPLAPLTHAQTNGPTATATLTFTIPARTTTSARRRPASVPPSSAQLVATATDTVSSATATTSASLATACTAATGGTKQCSVPIKAPIGTSVVFEVTVEDGSGNALATQATGTGVPIAEGASNVVPPIVLDPIPASVAVSFAGSAIGATDAAPLAIDAYDGATPTPDLIAGAGTFVTAPSATPDGHAATLTIGAWENTPTSGTFATTTCGAPTTSVTPWTTTSTLLFCPTATATLGSIYTLTLGGATTTFAARRSGFTPTQTTQNVSSIATSSLTAETVDGTDANASLFAASYVDGSFNGYVYTGQYGVAGWTTCSGSGASGPVVVANDGTHAFAVQHGFAKLFAYSLAPTCASAPTTLGGIGSDAVAMIDDPNPLDDYVYGITDNHSTDCNVFAVDVAGGTLAANGASCTGNGVASITAGVGDRLYVGSYDTTSIRSYTMRHLPPASIATIAIPTGTGTGAYVAGNADILYAVTVDASNANIQIWIVPNGSTAPTGAAYTYPATTTALETQQQLAVREYLGRAVIVGNDDRLYLAVDVGGSSEIDQYDPFTNTLTPSVISLAGAFDTTKPVTLGRGRSGTILVGGVLTSTAQPRTEFWP